MSRTVTALYDTRAEAEAARERLSSQFDVEGRARIIDKDSMQSSDDDSSTSFRSVPFTNEDRHASGEGLNRGGFMLCAKVDDDEDADRIVSVLEETFSIDMDQRQQSWRSEGWQPYGSQSADAATGQAFAGTGGTMQQQQQGSIGASDDQYMIGEREQNRGSPRVRSYIGSQSETDRSAFSGFGDDRQASEQSEGQPSDFERSNRD
jgi:hypothetical protein